MTLTDAICYQFDPIWLLYLTLFVYSIYHFYQYSIYVLLHLWNVVTLSLIHNYQLIFCLNHLVFLIVICFIISIFPEKFYRTIYLHLVLYFTSFIWSALHCTEIIASQLSKFLTLTTHFHYLWYLFSQIFQIVLPKALKLLLLVAL